MVVTAIGSGTSSLLFASGRDNQTSSAVELRSSAREKAVKRHIMTSSDTDRPYRPCHGSPVLRFPHVPRSSKSSSGEVPDHNICRESSPARSTI